jgi:hypothetical protein
MLSFFIKIKPQVDTAPIKKMEGEMSKIKKGFNANFGSNSGVTSFLNFLNPANILKIAAVSAAFALMNRNVQEGIDYLDQLLKKGDAIGTLATDIGMGSAETLALTQNFKKFGITQEDTVKLSENIRKAMVDGSMKGFEGMNLLDIVDNLIKQYGDALKSGDKELQTMIKDALGLRGGKQMELLGSGVDLKKMQQETLNQFLANEKKGTTIQDLSNRINRVGDKEFQQTSKLAMAEDLAFLRDAGKEQTFKSINTITETKTASVNNISNLATSEGMGTKLQVNLAKQQAINTADMLFDEAVGEFGKWVDKLVNGSEVQANNEKQLKKIVETKFTVEQKKELTEANRFGRGYAVKVGQ